MATGEKIVVGMSGGVDSSVAALLLVEAGYDVVGVSMRLYRCPSEGTTGCCTVADRNDAREVCRVLGIPHEVIEETGTFSDRVIRPFVEEYLRGRTPSPCTWCNRHLKFPQLLERADAIGAGRIATGHYSRVERGPDGRARLFAAAEKAKDQSYFLFALGERELDSLVLPVGGMAKEDVRARAREAGLPVHDKTESQEICFVPDDDYVAWLEGEAGGRLRGPGRFVDLDGNVIGTHKGIHAYTVGQRKGLGLGGGPKRHVVRIDADRNEVILGDPSDLESNGCVVGGTLWLERGAGEAIEAGESLGVEVKVRSRQRAVPAVIETAGEGRVAVSFESPISSVAPGQAGVFYRSGQVLGGGWIE